MVGLVGVTSAFTLGLPKSLLPIYTLEHVLGVFAKIGRDRVRVANGRSPDDGYRQRRDRL